jgi:hypothetical protein
MAVHRVTAAQNSAENRRGRRPAGAKTALKSGGVAKKPTKAVSSRVAYQSETLKAGTPLFRGHALSNRGAPEDVGFFYFDNKAAGIYALTHLRSNLPASSKFVTTRPLKLFVMNKRNLELLVSANPKAANLQRAVAAVTGLGMRPMNLYDKHRVQKEDREWSIVRCAASVCAIFGTYASYGAALAAVLGTGATGIYATGLHKPRRSRAEGMEIHDTGYLSQANAASKTIASKRLALEAQSVLSRQGFEGWVYADTQPRARALIDPRGRLGIGKFQKEVMLWNPNLKLRQ